MGPRFVGRADELAELVALLDAALDGRPGFAVLAGEPGIGKTRLAEELAALAGARAVPVLWGGCTAAEGAPAYWPWRRVLRAWLALVGRDGAARELAGFGEVARLAPELPGEPVESDRFALFDAVARFFVTVAEPAGLVLVLDDVQWADADSLALLAHVTREVTRGRLLVVATVRPAERDLALGGLVIELSGWDDAEVGAALGGQAAPEFVAAVARRSGGNPFFVGELVRAGSAALRVPAAARDVVRARIRRLPEPCRALLGAAAVLGRDVDAALMTSVTGAALDDLRPALDDGVLDQPPGRIGLRFTHDLVRESVLADLAVSERARVHLAVVDALTPSADDPDVVAELAHHALAALPAGDRAAATGWARRAAEIAHGKLAYDEAARLLADALAAGRGVLSPAERLSALLELARARSLAHDVAGAIATSTEAAELARATGDAAGLARAALGLPEVSNPEWLDAVRAWCAEALRGLGEGDSPLKAKVLAQLAHCALLVADARVIDEASAGAVAMAERLDDPASLANALRARQLARAGPDGNAERLVLGGRLLALGERTGDLEDVLWGRLWRFDALLQAGRAAEADAELAAVEPVVATLRRPLARLHLFRSQVALALGRGRFAEARELNEAAIAIAERGGDFGAAATARSVRLGMAASTGDEPGADDLDWVRTHPTRLHPMAALTRAQVARLLLDRGEDAEAREWYASLPEPGSPRIPAFIALALEGMRALLLPELGDPATAEAVHRELLPFANLHLVGGAGAVTTGGSVRGALGIAALVAGKPELAVRHLRLAVSANDAAGLAHPAVLTRFELAIALRARGRPSDLDEAAGLLVAADTAAERMGMAPLRARIAALGSAGGGVLSRREAEIAELVGRGLTNRQIAAATHISERTVETHVGHVLAKLGFTRRSEIAAWVAVSKQ